MPARRRAVKTEPETEPDDLPEHEQPEAERSEADEQEEAVASEFAPGAEAKVYRVNDAGMETFLAKVNPNVLTEEWLARQFGGGNYLVKMRKPRVGGGMVYAGLKRISVDPRIPAKTPRWLMHGDSPDASVDDPVEDRASGRQPSSRDAILDAGLLQLFQSMQRAGESQMTMMASVAEAMKPRVDLGSVLAAVAPLVVTMIESSAKRSEAQMQYLASLAASKTERDPLEVARTLAELSRGNKQEGGVRELIGSLRDLLSVRDMLGEQPEKDTGTVLLEGLLPQLGTLVELAAKRERQVPPAPVANPPSVAAPRVAALPPAKPVAVAGSSSTDQPQSDMQALVKQYAPYLVRWAREQRRPEVYAQVVVDMTPAVFRAPLTAFLSREDVTDVLLAAIPELQQYRDWVDSLGVEVLAILDPSAVEAVDDGEGEPIDGEDANAPDHGSDAGSDS